jgi:hypothetical protein
VHEVNKSICIDNLQHSEIADLFKKSKVFLSYDTRTFFSNLAVLSGCHSVVIPDKDPLGNDTPEPAVFKESGIAWGLENYQSAYQFRNKQIDQLREANRKSILSVESFIKYWMEHIK